MTDELTRSYLQRRLWAAYAISLASCGVAIAALLRDPVGDVGIRRAEFMRGIAVGHHTLGDHGLVIYGQSAQPALAHVRADDRAATVGVSRGGGGIELFAAGGKAVKLAASGAVSSELRIDTRTGAWSIVQHVSPERTVTIPLAPPIAQ